MTKISDIAMPSGGPYHGQTVVVTPGTEVPLGSSQSLKSGVSVKAMPNNTDFIYVGDVTVSSADGYPLAPGESHYVVIDNVSKVGIDAVVGGEGVAWIAT